MAAYANDVIGYIPSVRVLKEGGYEGGESFYGNNWPAPLADDIESIVVNAAHEVAKTVSGRQLRQASCKASRNLLFSIPPGEAPSPENLTGKILPEKSFPF